MHKLRDLQQQLAAAEERASGADRKSGNLTASLAAAQDKLAVAQHEAEARAAEAAKLTADMQRQAGDMLALQAKVLQEEEGRKAASTQVSVSASCCSTAVLFSSAAVAHTSKMQVA
jgi:chromosome segregation ATPase